MLDTQEIYHLQNTLVQLATQFSVFNIILILIGKISQNLSHSFGYRIVRFGAQNLIACCFLLFSHFILIEWFSGVPPILFLISIYGVVSLIIIQAGLGLLFGFSVSNRVISGMIIEIVRVILGVFSDFVRAIFNLFRNIR